MKIVLDANVVIAAFATRGLCHALFELCLQRYEIILSKSLLEEISRALFRKIKLPPKMVNEIELYLRHHARVEEPQKLSAKECRDPDDIKVLGLALKTGADFLITGDNDLLTIKKFRGIPILSPREFWEYLRK